MKHKIGILAYGSLINDPGIELEPLIVERIQNVKTPFQIEFARKSRSRGGAPTLVIVENMGSSVAGEILVLKPDISINTAENLLWRRETRNEDSDKYYLPSENPTPNHVIVEKLDDFSGVRTVLYTKIGRNIDDLNPQNLAKMAIESACGNAGLEKRDGISYLISVKEQGIVTPLISAYEEEILKIMSVDSLSKALNKLLIKT